MEIVFNQHESDTYQRLVRKVSERLIELKLLTIDDLTVIKQYCRSHGLELENENNEGYQAGVLVNRMPPDFGRIELYTNAKNRGYDNPRVQLQEGLINEFGKQGPITGILISTPDTIIKLNKVLEVRMQQFQKSADLPSQEILDRMVFESYIDVVKEGVDLGGVNIGSPVIEFRNLAEVEITAQAGSNQSRCLIGFVTGTLLLFSQQSKMVAQVALPFACR